MSENIVNEIENDEIEIEFPDIDVAEAEDVEEETAEPTTVEEIVNTLVNAITTKIVTPYGIHSVINNTFKILNIDIEIRPQMMYNYDRNGMIVKGKKGVKEYSHDEVKAYAIKFVNKRINK